MSFAVKRDDTHADQEPSRENRPVQLEATAALHRADWSPAAIT